MCNFTFLDITPEECPNIFDLLEDITDNEFESDLEAHEDMLAESEEDDSDGDNNISFKQLFKRNTLRMNILYNLNMYSDQFIPLHFWGVYYIFNEPNNSRVCCECAQYFPNVLQFSSRACHMSIKPCAMIMELTNLNCYCLRCDRFLFDTEDNWNGIECCEDITYKQENAIISEDIFGLHDHVYDFGYLSD